MLACILPVLPEEPAGEQLRTERNKFEGSARNRLTVRLCSCATSRDPATGDLEPADRFYLRIKPPHKAATDLSGGVARGVQEGKEDVG